MSGPSEVLAFMYDRSLDAYKWHNVSTGFSDHFTPYARFLMSPTLQNTTKDLYRIDGRFSTSRNPADFSWPSWKIVSSPYYRNAAKLRRVMGSRGGMMRMESAGFAGSIEMAECEEVDMCAEPAMAPVERMMLMKADAGKPYGEDEGPEVAPRKNLKETAFFFPDLETDAEGNVSLTFTVPDALTGWKLLMVAHDNELRSGILRNEEIVTVKPLMCEPNPPRFAREGDDFLFAVKVTNTEDSPQSGEVELTAERRSRVESGGVGRGRRTDDERQRTKD